MKTIKVKIEYPEYKDKVVCDYGGELVRSNYVLCTYPPKYKYICTVCGNEIITKEQLDIYD